MSFLSSPGVHVREIDLTNVVPSVATTVGAIAMPTERGPVSEITTLGSEEDLLKVLVNLIQIILNGGLLLLVSYSTPIN